jgi:hypothetical protein
MLSWPTMHPCHLAASKMSIFDKINGNIKISQKYSTGIICLVRSNTDKLVKLFTYNTTLYNTTLHYTSHQDNIRHDLFSKPMPV